MVDKIMTIFLILLCGVVLGYVWRFAQNANDWQAMQTQIVNAKLAGKAVDHHGVGYARLIDGVWMFSRDGDWIPLLRGVKK